MKLILLLLGSVLAFTGCSSPLLRPVTTALLSGGGAAVGSVVSRGHPVGAAVGGLGGAAISETAFHIKTKSEQRAYEAGRKEAFAAQVKSQYWQQQYRHWPAPSTTMELPVPLPERITPDGVRLVPSIEFIQVRQ